MDIWYFGELVAKETLKTEAIVLIGRFYAFLGNCGSTDKWRRNHQRNGRGDLLVVLESMSMIYTVTVLVLQLQLWNRRTNNQLDDIQPGFIQFWRNNGYGHTIFIDWEYDNSGQPMEYSTGQPKEHRRNRIQLKYSEQGGSIDPLFFYAARVYMPWIGWIVVLPTKIRM